MDRSTLQRKSVDDLREIAKQLDLTGVGRLRKADLIDTIIGEMDDDQGADAGDDEQDADASSSGDADSSEEKRDARHRDEVIERRRSRSRNRRDDDAADDRDNDRDNGDDNGDDNDRDNGGGTGSSNGNGNGRGNGRSRARSRDRRQPSKGRGDLEGLDEREGVLDLLPEGYGFLRTTGYVSGPRDVYVSQSYVRRFNLRRGDLLGGPVRFNKGNDKFPALARLETCEGVVVENEHDPILRDRPDFTDLDVAFPDQQLELADGGGDVLAAVDLFAPVGRGQRALLLVPPAADTGALVRAVAAGVANAADDVEIFVALLDARPEEIAECDQSLDAEVVGSPLDAPAEDHVAAAELVIERAKRLAERGQDVVVVLDSLTQLGRAYNLAGSATSRTLPGGIDAAAIGPLKQLFGAARNLAGDGSLTLLAVAGVDPDSETDRTIVDHLRGAGNAELRFDPTLGAVEDVPALDVRRSGTRRAEALVGQDTARAASAVRRTLAEVDPGRAWEVVAGALSDGADTDELLKAAEAAADDD